MPSEGALSRLFGGQFVRGLIVQKRVLSALLVREMLTRYGRNNIGFLWLFAEPMLFILAVALIWRATRSIHGSDIPIVAFALTGYPSMLLWRNTPGRCIGAVSANRSLLFHRQVRVLDVLISRIVLEIGALSSALVLLGIMFWSIDWLEAPEDALKVLGGWAMLAWFGAGLAMTLAGLAEKFDIIQKLWAPFSYMFAPFAGTAFLANAVPEPARDYLLYLPMLNCVEVMRDGYFGSKIIAHYDVAYVLIFNTVLTLTGLVMIRLIGVEEGTGE